jgi:hypothetical protein
MDDEKLKQIVNSSGFPLQISIEHAVEKIKPAGWYVATKEFSWRDDTEDFSGYIDIVLKNRNIDNTLTIECKRVKSTSWIFLCPDPKQKNRRQVKGWVTQYQAGKLINFGWNEIPGDPSCAEAEFCVVDGQDSKSKPMLERVASELVMATESFARKDREYFISKQDRSEFIVPVIVTTAELKLCCFSPENISPEGEISGAAFETIPYVRFRKQLSTREIDINKLSRGTYYEISRMKENTVFVVNSDHFISFLNDLEFD